MKIAAILALALVSAVEAAPPNCNRMCPKILKPVCGSNDVTYDNDCYFDVAKCLMGADGKDLYIKHEGECAAKPASPSCFIMCPGVMEPVCASNGITYDNACKFDVAKCKLGDAGKDLFIKHDGYCEAKPSTTCDDIVCPDVIEPVCGSNMITYHNACEFDVAKCKLGDAGKDLYIKHDGYCSRAAVNAAAACNTICADVYAPVCASNGESFRNKCKFNVAKCKLGDAGKDLTIKHDGECGDIAKRALRAEIGCDIGCIDVYEPVCGSDMITYNNECELRVAKCTTNDPTLAVLYPGFCRR
ncbi:hypothetical protein ATCC90586_011101 [Pythium insidiosum]|nr:hypothetical protein ATCC90586_011101 [Pythium insidiosum]